MRAPTATALGGRAPSCRASRPAARVHTPAMAARNDKCCLHAAAGAPPRPLSPSPQDGWSVASYCQRQAWVCPAPSPPLRVPRLPGLPWSPAKAGVREAQPGTLRGRSPSLGRQSHLLPHGAGLPSGASAVTGPGHPTLHAGNPGAASPPRTRGSLSPAPAPEQPPVLTTGGRHPAWPSGCILP